MLYNYKIYYYYFYLFKYGQNYYHIVFKNDVIKRKKKCTN